MPWVTFGSYISALDATWAGKVQAFLVCILGIYAPEGGKSNGGVSGENDSGRQQITSSRSLIA